MKNKTLLQRISFIPSFYLCVFLFFITLCTYANTLGNGLFFDDEDFIYNNQYVKEFSVDKYFTQNAIAGAGKMSNYYRPLQLLSNGTEYKLFGLAPFIIHLDNLLLQITAGMLLYIFIIRLFQNKLRAFFTSILFLIHPIQAEAVSYASGRNDPMAAIFIFLTLIFFMKKTTKSYFISLFFFILALLSRESAIVTPGLLFCVMLIQTKSWKKSLGKIPSLLPFFGLSVFYFFLRLTALNFKDSLDFYQDGSLYSSSILVRLLTFFSIIPIYIALLFYPKELHMERIVPVVSNLSPTVFLSVMGIFFIIAISIIYFKKYPLVLFAVFWFFIALAPTSGVIPINGIFYEHFLYVPCIGIFLLIAFGLTILIEKISNPVMSMILLLLIGSVIFLLCVRTISRNQEWHDPITFYSQIIVFTPNSARVHNNLAMAYADNQDLNKAIHEYTTAIHLQDTSIMHLNLANAYIAQKKYKVAEKEILRAITLDPKLSLAYIRLASLYEQTGQSDKLEALKKKIK